MASRTARRPDWGAVLLRMCGRRLPRTHGTVRVSGLNHRLVIRRDQWAIPHVEAASPADAWFGLGFCHAQDRGFQLEMILRVGRGTVAALVGQDGLAIDRMSRRIGFRRAAEAQLPLLEPSVRAAVDAYVAGIRAGQARGGAGRPHELVLLRARPTPWEALDVATFAVLQSFALAANWDVELARLKILADDGPEALAALEAGYPSWLPVTSPVGDLAGESLDRLADDLAAFATAAPSAGGSNNWAIAGSRTASGMPILANDPHLAPRLPAPWYLAHLRCPEWEVAGASFVGSPTLPIGHNGHAAWGITAGLTDQTDLFIEEIGADGVTVREADGYVACEVRRETIEVRGSQPVEETVLVTHRGPIITPLLADPPASALSLSAVWLRPLPIRGFLDCVAARSFDEFRESFADWPGPALNIVYADVSGRIGYQLVGQLPRRRRGNGMLPLPAWMPDAGWEDDLVPFEAMPCLADPPEGFVATANNQPIRDTDEPLLGADSTDGYRLARIVEVLARRSDWDVAGCADLQVDYSSVPWRELRDIVLALPVAGDGATGVELLRAWDGKVTADSSAASVFELFLSELSKRLAKAKAPKSWRWALGAGFGEIVPSSMLATRSVGRLVRLLREQPDGWFARGWPAEAAAALSAAVSRLRIDHGTDAGAWAWGRLRTLTLAHPMERQEALAKAVNLGPVPIGGDANTPGQAASGPLNPFANPGFLANTRAVIDLADLDGGLWVLAGGQSGNPLSPHYGDLFPLWLRGEGVPIPWSAAAVEAATVATLTLDPEG